MDENIANSENNIGNKSKLKFFYENNKRKIFIILSSILILFLLLFYYLNNQNKKILKISGNYITAKIYLANGQKEKAKKLLKHNISLNNSTYSTLSLFLMLNENLLSDEKEVSNLFNYILINCTFKKEIKDLLIFKKALFESNYVDEAQLLISLKPLLNNDSLWKPHALLLLGDYYVDKKENIKARDFYEQILNIKNLSEDFYSKANIQLIQISDAN